MPSAGSVHVDVLPDTRRFGPQLRTQLRQIAASTRPDIAVRVRVDTGAAMTRLRALRTLADELDGRLVRMGTATSGETTGASTPLAGVGGDRTSTVRVNTTQATTALRGVSAQVSALNGKTARVKVEVDPKSAARTRRQLQNFSDISPAAATAASVLVPPAAPLAGAAVGGAAGLLPGLGAGIMGAGAFATAAVPAIMQVADVMALQREAATGSEEATAAYEAALIDLSPHARTLADDLGELGTEFREWQESLQVATLPVVSRGVGLLTDNLGQLTPIVIGASRGFDSLLESAEAGLAGPHWTRFTSFAARQAEPTIGSLGRTIGSLTMGITGLMVSFEPLWDTMSAGLERSAASFATWANDSSNFTGFIEWTIENGPMLMGVLGDISGAAIDLGVAISPLGLIYAQGIGLLAQGISWLTETSPGLLRLAVAAVTARMALQLLSRINQGLIVPLRELPGRVQEFTAGLRGMDTTATTAAASGGRLRGALSGVVGALGGPWGVAIGLGITALGAFIMQKQQARQKVDEYTAALRADTGAIGENTRATAVAAIEKAGLLQEAERLGYAVQDVTDAVLGEGDAFREINADIDDRIAKYDEMYDQGEISQQQWAGHVTELMNLKDSLAEEGGAVDESTEAYRRHQEAMGGSQEAQLGVNGALAEGAANARDLKTALDELTMGAVSAIEAEAGFQAAIDRATESVAVNGQTLDVNTEQGRANRDALSAIRDTLITKTDATWTDTGAMGATISEHRRGREEFIAVARQMGLTADEAEDLADEYLGIPAEVETSIIARATGTWSVPNASDVSPRGGAPAFYSTGGAVHGPGTKTSDSIDARLSDGEFVQRARAVDKYGVGFMSALNEGRINREDLPGFARGGYVTRTSKGVGEDAAAQINDHREDVRVEIQRMYMDLVNGVGATMAEQLRRAASEGGGGAAGRALSQRGVPYSWGGGGPGGPSRGFGRGANTVGFDCSSLMQYAWAPWVNLPRVTYSQINSGQSVSRSQAMRGDLMFPHRGHVTMYLGGNQMVHAPRTGDVVRTAPAYSNPIAIRRPTRRARGGPVDSGQWSWVGEEGPELVRFSSPGQVYSAEQSQRIAADARPQAAGGGSAAPLVGSQSFHLHSADDGIRELADTMTHEIRVISKGGRYADG
ncbi:C40 family peptidase [Nocardiopsis sp. NPDC101807]|uniref:C40 family peptidase n=1 Tax=Nocardiopsis sp. NPDC101807 TaxID=3364339 RepID=UPI00380CB121